MRENNNRFLSTVLFLVLFCAGVVTALLAMRGLLPMAALTLFRILVNCRYCVG